MSNNKIYSEGSGPEQNMKKKLRSVFVALFAALISAGAFIMIPIGPIPIVLQNMLVVLAGVLMGAAQGGAAAGLFLTAGALGIPVFAGGKGGFAHFAGPTGGFLIGYFLAALVAGFYAGKPSTKAKTPTHRIFAGTVLAYGVIYIPGVLQFQALTGSSLAKAIALSATPFLVGDLIKIALTIPLAIILRPLVARYLFD